MEVSEQLAFPDAGTVQPQAACPSRPPKGTAAAADRAALAALTEALRAVREQGDTRPPLVVLAACLGELGGTDARRTRAGAVSLEQARDDWLRRLQSARRSRSAVTAYRVALDELLVWLARTRRDPFCEETMVAYFADYLDRRSPAPATYYRRFVLVRAFFRWLARRSGACDPFLDLQAPAKPQQERDWLTPAEFARLLAAAERPQRRLAGLVERDRLVLLALVATGLRRAELCAVRFADLRLDHEPTLLVRHGKGERPRRQPLPPLLARELGALQVARAASADDPVFCGLQGGALQPTILADIIRRCAMRAGLEKHVTAHTLRHTAATWLRQQTGDARLVAEYLGHADLSTVSRYTHVTPPELASAAHTIEAIARSAAWRPAVRPR